MKMLGCGLTEDGEGEGERRGRGRGVFGLFGFFLHGDEVQYTEIRV